MAEYLNYNMPEHEKLKECPYNKSHQVPTHRFQIHLVKCRRSYPESKAFKTCKFNSAHVFPHPEIALHEKTCESSLSVLHFMYDERKDSNKSEEDIAPVTVNCSENWDNENVSTYNPKKNCEDKKVILNIQHMTRAERKAARIAERDRLNNLNYKHN